MRFGFDVQSNGSGSNRWRLIDPLGQVVFGPSTLADTGLLTATMAGTYTLLVEGRNSQTADTGYRFLFDVPESLPANGATEQAFATGCLPHVSANNRGAAAQLLNDGDCGRSTEHRRGKERVQTCDF